MRIVAAFDICLKALAIFLFFSALGLMVNHFSPQGIPLIYSPPPQTEINGIKVPLIDEKQASRHLNEPGYAFVDTRHPEHFHEAHVPGAVFLPPEDVQERFVEAQPFLMETDTLILYCYGPDCDMAERVAGFLSQMGYKSFMIMQSGFSAWKSSGLPVESSRR